MVRAGDKVGLVGRNGAGKTSLLKVAGRRAAELYEHRLGAGAGWDSSQDRSRSLRKPFGDPTNRPDWPTLSGRGLDEIAAGQLEKLRIAAEEHASDQAISPLCPGRGRVRQPGATPQPNRRCGSWWRVWGSAPTGSTSHSVCCPARAPPGGAGPHPVRGTDVLMLDELINRTGQRCQELADVVSAGLSRRGCWMSATTSTCSTRPSPASSTSTKAQTRRVHKGTYSCTASAAADEVRVSQAGHPPARRRSATLRSWPTCCATRRRSGSGRQVPRQAGDPVAQTRRRVATLPSVTAASGPVPRAAPQRPGGAGGRRVGQGVRRPCRVRGRELRGGARRAPADHGTEWRRQDEPAPHPRRMVGAIRWIVPHWSGDLRGVLRPGA